MPVKAVCANCTSCETILAEMFGILHNSHTDWAFVYLESHLGQQTMQILTHM